MVAKMTIILVILIHILSSGGGRGNGVPTALSLSRLHILSYAIVAISYPFCFTNESNHCIRIKKTCEGDSDLQKRTNLVLDNRFQSHLYL